MSKHKSKSQIELAGVIHNGTRYEPGDCVLINADGKDKPFIGRIKHLYQSRKDDPEDVKVEVAWFYRPEEAVGGRKNFHGEQELFDSDHLDTVHKNTILSKCRVLTLEAYEELHTVEEQDFFHRFKYKPQSSEFEPDRVPVYCVCESPYNPDKLMLMCDVCHEWYHVECIGLSPEESKRYDDPRHPYVCTTCVRPGYSQHVHTNRA